MIFDNFKQKVSDLSTKVSSKQNTIQGMTGFFRAYLGKLLKSMY